MSFPSVTGILMPDEFAVVHGVYASIATEEWFTTSPRRREQFAASVIDIYREGVTNPSDLALRCKSLALQKFGNGGVDF